MKHTALPWHYTGYGDHVGEADRSYHEILDDSDFEIANQNGILSKEDASFIVKACNSHYELVEALEGLVGRLDSHFGGANHSYDWKEQEEARKAIAKAKEVIK